MKVTKNDLVVFFDIDDTLVKWEGDPYKLQNGALEVIDQTDGTKVYLIPHEKHIELLKKYKARGWCIKVWSGGGWSWAESVIKALNLENYVDEVLSKPLKIVDDLDPIEWMPGRIYLKDYKK